MAFRVVDKSSISFETDLPPSLRNIHPSGVLHASRADQEISNTNEHVFAWVQNSLEVNNLLDHLEQTGFNRSHGIVFIPYSTSKNWMMRYPHAPLTMECTDEGSVAECSTNEGTGNKEEIFSTEAVAAGGNSDGAQDKGGSKAEKRKYEYKCRTSMVGDMSLLPDPERDELHIEIYNYLTWLHKKVAEIEDKEVADLAVGMEEEMGRDDDNKENDDEPARKKKGGRKRKRCSPDVNVPELKGVLKKLESTFYIIPNMKYEVENEGGDPNPERDLDSVRKGAPFLEEALGPALTELVQARAPEGRPRRRSRRKKPKARNPRKSDPGKYDPERFEQMFERLVRFKEKHGHCRVSHKFEDDPELAVWVSRVREQKIRSFDKQGARSDEPDRKLTATTLNSERVERLEALGFLWKTRPSNRSWEDHFRQMMEYYQENGKWPPCQASGRLGEWVRHQRRFWVTNDENFMKKRAPLLDEVGFEWTPKGYYLINWDEGFEKLMAFGQANGHYNVPCPTGEGDGVAVNKKSDAFKFYRWVESLHAMYRSFKLGRQSGSLTEERISSLIRCGFTFRDE